MAEYLFEMNFNLAVNGVHNTHTNEILLKSRTCLTLVVVLTTLCILMQIVSIEYLFEINMVHLIRKQLEMTYVGPRVVRQPKNERNVTK